MVCKEDLCTWFRNLSPHKRIDYMCGILHLCFPIELRFLGSYVEFLAKKDFHHLRDIEGKANNKQELSNNNDIDKMISQMAFYLALLHSSNRTCAHQLFLILKHYMQTTVTMIDRMDTQSVHNILLVLSMAMNHPAFNFVEKTEMSHFYSLAEQEAAKAKEKSAIDRHYLSEPYGLYDLDLGTPLMFTPDVLHVHTANCQPVAPAQTMYSMAPPVVNIPVETGKVHVKHLEVKDSRSSKTDVNTIEYCIQVTWSNGEKRDIYKTLTEIMDFHKRMSKEFPDGFHSFKMKQLTANTSQRKDMTSSLNEYVQKLLDLQANIKYSITFRKFFGVVVLTADASTSPPLQSLSHDNNPVTKHVPNSGNKDSVIEADTDNQNLSPLSNCLDGPRIGNICSMTNFGSSPQDLALPAHSRVYSTKITSPLLGYPCQSTSSESPTNSCLGSPYVDRVNCNRLASFLKCHDLVAYQNVLANYTFEQLSVMKVEEIESIIGLPKEVAITMKSLFDGEKIKDLSPRPLNGIVDRMLPQNANLAAHSPQTVFPPQVYNTVPPALVYAYQPFQNSAPQPVIVRDPSPTNSDSSSLSPRSCIQASPSLIAMQSNVQSQSDSSSEEDKFARQPNGNGNYKGHSPFIPYLSHQCDQLNNDKKYEPISSSEMPSLAADLSEVISLGSSGYRSDPTFDNNSAHFLRSPNTAKPTHTQNINPQYLITMPGNSVPHHNATMTTASDGLGYSLMQYVDNRHMYYVNNSNMIGRTYGPLTGPRSYYNPAVNPLLNQQQNVVNSVGKLSVYPGTQGVPLHNITGAVTGNNVMLNGNDNSQKIQCVSAADASAGRMPVAVNSATPGCATVTSTSNSGSISHPRCTFCGCSGHANSIPSPGIPFYHPFPCAWPPYPNGYMPMSHSLYLPHQTPYSSGLNQEVYANHAPNFAVPNPGAQGMAGSQVMQSPSNLNNSNHPPGGYSKKKSGKINCSNCGSMRHSATECPDGSMEAMSGPAIYSYRPSNESD